MYTFKIKDNTPDINLLVSRCLLVLAAIGALIFRNNQAFVINLLVSIVLLSGAITANVLVKKYKWNGKLLLLIGSFILIVATHSIIFSAILLLIEFIIKKLYRQPIVEIKIEGVEIKKMLGNKLHLWDEFNNVILKDNLLTLDFKDNNLWQLNILDGDNNIDEGSFNNFCSKYVDGE